MLTVTVTYTRTNPSFPFTLWTPPEEYISFIKSNYEDTGIKSLPETIYHFADDHTETLSHDNPQPWNKNWTVMIRTLTFQSLDSYNNFHNIPLVQNAIQAERDFYAPQGVTFTRTYTGE